MATEYVKPFSVPESKDAPLFENAPVAIRPEFGAEGHRSTVIGADEDTESKDGKSPYDKGRVIC